MNRILVSSSVALAALLAAGAAHASRVDFSVGIGLPAFGAVVSTGPAYHAPRPRYYVDAPRYYDAPVYAAPVYAAPPLAYAGPRYPHVWLPPLPRPPWAWGHEHWGHEHWRHDAHIDYRR